MTGRGCPASPVYGPQSLERVRVRVFGPPNRHRASQGVVGTAVTCRNHVQLPEGHQNGHID